MGVQQEIERLLSADTETLYAIVGYHVEPPRLGAAPKEAQQLAEAGQSWLARSRGRLQQAICGDPRVQKFLNSEAPSQKELEAVILAVTDLIVSAVGGVPAVTVAVLLVRLGLRGLCCG